jgi:23S rRNA (adenine2503-C2)-methyltransferase
MKICFFEKSSEDFAAALSERGFPAYRARQINDWVWQQGVSDIQKMENLPKALRDEFVVHSMSCDLRLESKDGTIKRRLTLNDGEQVESVSIPIKGQWTVCLSSQTGCAMGCGFCATGLKTKFRNLTGLEIVEQALWHWADTGEKPSRIVFMGMGEPLANRKGLEEAIQLLTGAMGLSSRRLTVSTVGRIDGMAWLSEFKPAVNLALSLHSAIDETRSQLVASARSSVKDLVGACRDYREATGRDVTFEAVLLSEVNDDVIHAEAMAAQAGSGIHVNLIPYNPGGAGDFEAPDKSRIKNYCDVLKRAEVSFTLRSPRGQDINAACGELTI